MNFVRTLPCYRCRDSRLCQTLMVSKFKIGQAVCVRSSVRTGRPARVEYRIVRQLPLTNDTIRYRVRSSADERDEMVVKESDLRRWGSSNQLN